MKKLKLFFIIFVPLFINAQVNESFSDGDFFESPEWIGHTSNFAVNADKQLQSKALSTSVSWLFTPSFSIDNASWECSLRINYTTSSSNYASVYIVSDVSDLSDGCNGYYVQVGGTNDEVSLFLQQGSKKTKIIDGTDKRTDGNPVNVKIKVERDEAGNFVLYSKLPDESDFQLEGKTINTAVKTTMYFGLLCSNTSTTGNAYFFDDILVTGKPAKDNEKPDVTSMSVQLFSKIIIQFSEPVDVSVASFDVDNGIGSPTNVLLQNNKKTVELTFAENFESGKIYAVSIGGVTDLAGNKMDAQVRRTGIAQMPLQGDIRWNELMFNAPDGGQEYVELINTSDKVIDLSKIAFAARKSDGTLNSAVTISSGSFIGPSEIVALALSPDSVSKFHNVPARAQIVATNNWYSLNNESATIALCNAAKDTVYDEIQYDSRWHHVLISNPKGVSLERIQPQKPTQDATNWHSAASEVNYGTPGYQNSQFRESDDPNPEKTIWCDPEVFSPDNDGTNDICFIQYNTGYAGFVATVSVFNPAGIKVANLAQNALLSANGSITWDGKTLRGTNAETGIYVVYFEMFHPVSGKKMNFKLPLVVSAR